MTVKPLNDCFLHDKDRLRHDDALALLRERLMLVAGKAKMPLAQASGAILAADIEAPRDVPLHTNAAVDGYAFAHPAPAEAVAISARIEAGDLSPPVLATGTAARIFTGAPMPLGADTVAMQEDCEATATRVKLPPVAKGANCRERGEDVRAGDVVLRAGRRLDSSAIAALASLGLDPVTVHRPLQVALFSTGAELVAPDAQFQLQTGQVFDSNGPMLESLLQSLPCAVTRFPVISDDRQAVLDALSQAASSHDVVITSGGASRGEADHMLDALDTLGTRHLWQLAVKPGRPMMMGQIARKADEDSFVFGLPGNPVAAMVCFQLYVRPALLRLAGADWFDPPRYPIAAGFEIGRKKPDRREFIRGWIEGGVAQRFDRDGSGLISSLTRSDGLIEIPEEVTTVRKGDIVAFIPWTAFS